MYTNLKELLPDSKEYENIAHARDVDHEQLNEALVLVEKYIKDKNLILYGGMAIDFSLKAQGHDGIYAEPSIPDYDFMTSDPYNDSNELADILHKAGLTNISSINAKHVTSRRVRVNFTPVADLTYVPESILSKIPTTKYRGLRVVHPDFQRLDMHRAFSTPYEHVPQELIYFRAKKDMARFKLLDATYPIKPSKKTLNTTKITIPITEFKDKVVGGMAAYAFMYKAISSIDPDFDKDIYDPDLEIKPEGITFNSPDKTITVLSENLFVESNPENATYFNKFMDDIIPRSMIVPRDDYICEFLDTKGRLLPTRRMESFIKNLRTWAPHYAKRWKLENFKNTNICIMQTVLMYFLAKYFLYNNDNWLYLYWSASKLVVWAERLYLDNPKCNKPEFLKLPLFLTAEYYGSYNWDYSYVVTQHRLQAQIYDRDKLLELSTVRPPHGYYPDKNIPPPEFKLTSWVFQIDGKQQKEPHTPLYLIAH